MPNVFEGDRRTVDLYTALPVWPHYGMELFVCLSVHPIRAHKSKTSTYNLKIRGNIPPRASSDILFSDRLKAAIITALLPAGCRKAANYRYCFYSRAKNQHFHPAGATRCTDSCKIWQDQRAHGSAWPYEISRQSVHAGGNAAPKIAKISTFW